jgi:hypothetical protein
MILDEYVFLYEIEYSLMNKSKALGGFYTPYEGNTYILESRPHTYRSMTSISTSSLTMPIASRILAPLLCNEHLTSAQRPHRACKWDVPSQRRSALR